MYIQLQWLWNSFIVNKNKTKQNRMNQREKKKK